MKSLTPQSRGTVIFRLSVILKHKVWHRALKRKCHDKTLLQFFVNSKNYGNHNITKPDTARAWLKQYTSKPEEGRKSLISIAPLFDNDTLCKIMQKPEHGPQQLQFCCTKVNYRLKQTGQVHTNIGERVHGLLGKKCCMVQHCMVKALRHAYIVLGVLTRSIIEGEDALRHAYISSGSLKTRSGACEKLYVERRTIIGDYAFVKTRFTGNYILNYATIKGMCVLSKSHFEGEDPLIEAHNRSLMTVTDPWEHNTHLFNKHLKLYTIRDYEQSRYTGPKRIINKHYQTVFC